MHRPILTTALAATLLLACGGSDDDAGSSATTTKSREERTTTTATEAADEPTSTSAPAGGGSLCRVLTQDEAEAIAGVALENTSDSLTPGPAGDLGSCVYLVRDEVSASTIVNVVLLGTTFTREQFDTELAADAAGAQAVEGPGEVALLLQPGILQVFDDGTALSVQIIVGGSPAATDVLVDVAEQVLDRLSGG